MPVYNGNSKVGYLYYGGTKIKEAYYGSTKVYSDGIPVYKYDYVYSGYSYTVSILNVISIDSISIAQGTNGVTTAIISNISGTLGSSGSSIKRIGDTTTYTYDKTITKTGITVYEYKYVGVYGIIVNIFILPGSTIGSIAIVGINDSTIQSITESTLVLKLGSNTFTATRDTSFNKKWTVNGLV